MAIWRRQNIYDLCYDLDTNNYDNIVVTGGYFQILHAGHIQLFQHSAKYGKLIVIVNDDEACIRKSGYCFMPIEHRLAVINEMKSVYACIDNDKSDIADIIKILQPQCYTKGGDVGPHNLNQAERLACEHCLCKIIFDVGGKTKMASSSRFLGNYANWVTTLRGEAYNIEENYI